MPDRPPVPFEAVPILAPLTAEDRAAITPLCELRAFEKGEALFEEGQPALFIHFLFVGRVKIVKAAPERDLILEILGAGEPVGTVAAFENRPFPATAVALEPSGTISIPVREFFRLTERDGFDPGVLGHSQGSFRGKTGTWAFPLGSLALF